MQYCKKYNKMKTKPESTNNRKYICYSCKAEIIGDAYNFPTDWDYFCTRPCKDSFFLFIDYYCPKCLLVISIIK